jgi:hypothetical protein
MMMRVIFQSLTYTYPTSQLLKKTKIIFVSTERSHQEDVSNRFKKIYDGTQKSYPNGSMMLFIPLAELQTSPSFCAKILFNHMQYLGEETIFSIGGLQDLNNTVLLQNGKATSIHLLLKCLPASAGMSRPLLFQNAEPNSSNVVTMVSYQKQDHPLVITRQAKLNRNYARQ